MDKMDGLSLDLEKGNINKIKELFPEAVEEGKINFDMLRAFLGDEVDDSREKYQFTWNGKAKSIKLAQTPSSATLRPCKEKSKNWDTTENLYIEGDNLEVLKQLQKTYYGKIKMIYIDPPYNTGNDFVYNDSFSNSIENYKEQTSQASSSNPETNGRFHTDWLNMMYPRLILARNLLTDDGVFMCSIGNKEAGNLKLMLDGIFGENNYLGIIDWESKTKCQNTETAKYQLQNKQEYIYVYKKSISRYEFNLVEIGKREYPETDENGNNYRLEPIGEMAADGTRGRKSMIFDIMGIMPKEGNQWKYGEETINKYKTRNDIVKKNNKVYLRIRPNDEDAKMEPFWSFIPKEIGTAETAKKELINLIKARNFETVKPVKLIKKLLYHTTSKDCIILDIFSGSATTAHATMSLNYDDGGNRKFIMVQLPELYNEQKDEKDETFKNICEIGEERIRRAGEQIKAEWEKEHPNDGLFASEETFNTDIGFKVFKLDSTNLIPWDNSEKYNEVNLYNLNNIFKEDRNSEDVLYEIMLKYGVFDKRVEEIEVNGKTMYSVGKRYMIVCLDNSVTYDDIKAIGELSPRTVIFKESGFIDDNAKINAVYNLEKAGVEDVKCI